MYMYIRLHLGACGVRTHPYPLQVATQAGMKVKWCTVSKAARVDLDIVKINRFTKYSVYTKPGSPQHRLKNDPFATEHSEEY